MIIANPLYDVVFKSLMEDAVILPFATILITSNSAEKKPARGLFLREVFLKRMLISTHIDEVPLVGPKLADVMPRAK